MHCIKNFANFEFSFDKSFIFSGIILSIQNNINHTQNIQFHSGNDRKNVEIDFHPEGNIKILYIILSI
jgi:hypothetical protein